MNIKKLLLSRTRIAKQKVYPWRAREKHYAGSLFDRFRGLQPLFDRAQGSTVLDVGSSDGLISYEFARRGSTLIHGLELDPFSVQFSKYLFREIPIDHLFLETDLALGVRSTSLPSQTSGNLCEKYDIVLFLGVYHHLLNQVSKEEAGEIVRHFANLARGFFAVRTNTMSPVDDIVRNMGFELCSTSPAHSNVGLLHIYQSS